MPRARRPSRRWPVRSGRRRHEHGAGRIADEGRRALEHEHAAPACGERATAFDGSGVLEVGVGLDQPGELTGVGSEHPALVRALLQLSALDPGDEGAQGAGVDHGRAFASGEQLAHEGVGRIGPFQPGPDEERARAVAARADEGCRGLVVRGDRDGADLRGPASIAAQAAAELKAMTYPAPTRPAALDASTAAPE